ncbi:UvrD-helicase domain-containing protein [Nocardioides mesophilus]|uniref:RecBCD enzyme subunit RecB n=1 Tax=Nocardioides mesophilus TaxID=433659 RepID=A0A7G9RHR1_9ACTN|nr:UvrD-helicase domain-containing protein [Nocardioides mesophilus]
MPDGAARAADADVFDICGPLPVGTTLLEASAGTGKTWTIGALVTRYVAEGVATLDQMLIVTFGRAASQELRERVRGHLVDAERALTEPDGAGERTDLVELLLDAPPEERELRRQRLRDALGAFDAATIATTHQFCHLVLRSLGVAGDTDSNATLVEDLDDLLGEVVDDLYLRAFGDLDGDPPFSHRDALRLARAAAGDPQARLEPRPDDAASDSESADPGGASAGAGTGGGARIAAAADVPSQRVAFAAQVREELDRRKRRLGVLSYDDLLSQLADALADDEAPARQRMRQRWSVVLVDEFQDTDPVQWQVLDRAFSGHATMVLIGDPKQAIYAFRGGDVTTYLQAAATATTRQTLGKNWRTDAALVDSLEVVLGGAALGDDQIVVRHVDAQHQGSRLVGAGEPFRLRVVRKELLGARRDLNVAQIRTHLYDDVARDIKRLLTSGASFEGRPLEPRDVAVLAFRNADLQQVQRALAGIGVPAVVAGSGSVFATPAATEWLRLLEALEQPHRSARVRSAALTPFFGYGAAELDAGGDALTDRVAATVRDWAALLASRGVAAVLEAAVTGGLTARVLSRADGERLLTDLRHVGQSLHQVAVEERLGLVALLTWLRGQMADDKLEVAADRTRRLDSDAAAVQLVTIHGSKGLEYPVVYLPTLWDRYPQKPAVPRFHSAAADGAHRCIDVGNGGPGWSEHVARAMAEDDGESLRLLYVALTRARSQVVAWWAPAPKNTPCSALQRMLFGRTPGTALVKASQDLHDEDDVARILGIWQSNGGPVWEESRLADLPVAALPVDERQLGVRRFTRWVDTAWRRTSYSSLSAAATEPEPARARVGSEPEEQPKQDEPDLTPVLEAPAAAEPSPDAVPSPMAGLPVGATFGSLVHAVLEHADPECADLRAELLQRIGEELVRWPVALDPEELADALVQVCDSPLGPLADGATLRGIPLRDRLREMEFELPLAGGDVAGYPAAPVTLGDVAPLLRAHLPAGDPLLPYADALAVPALGGQDLRGYLTGSVDVVLRARSGATVRYLVVDYKTNWLGGFPGEGGPALSSDDYRPAALRAAMGHSDYPLQALLYAVVLHRFLRWRQPGYDPAVHLGGVLYLYLRGMCGPETPLVDGHPCGVFSWQPPVALVEALSDLLDGVAPASTEGVA